ncbi:MoxR family ATPase [Paraneptunicella aestuarii]|uniref:AAA family ATPase n=1 Tax=Paraneptunicella aestuarii TaxID=2831148 RepID=UPI001E5C671C|nr:MoxR family ATPase [Paraneptunicella aestuarii]UAA39526.1 MoxR family ATPase [Paraneptunicella aestuarii]
MDLSKFQVNEPFEVGAMNGLAKTYHVFDQQQLDAIRTAWFAKRPLLIKGEPGLGKSQIAQAIADRAGWNLIVHVVHSRSEPEDLLYHVDHVSRLAQAQLVSNHVSDKNSLNKQHFVVPGPLWWAYSPETAQAFFDSEENDYKTSIEINLAKPSVVLIDEIDKAGSELPNSLLEVLNNKSFHAHGHDKAICSDPDKIPFVIITSNAHRPLPHAFLRRCVVLELSLKKGNEGKKQLQEIAKAHHPELGNLSPELIDDVIDVVLDFRSQRSDQQYKPGTSEFLDLLKVLNDDDQYNNETDRKDAIKIISRHVLNK